MGKDFLDRWLPIISNIGVIIGLIFLAVEIRQNNDLMASEKRFNTFSGIVSSYSAIAANSELAEAWSIAMPSVIEQLRSNPAFADLSDTQLTQAGHHAAIVLRRWEWQFLEGSTTGTPIEYLQRVLSGEFLLEMWNTSRNEFDPDFANFIDTAVLQL